MALAWMPTRSAKYAPQELRRNSSASEWKPPFVRFTGAGPFVAVPHTQVVRNGEPEDSEDQIPGTDGASVLHLQATFSSRASWVGAPCSSALATFQAVRDRTGWPRKALANVGREIPAASKLR